MNTLWKSGGPTDWHKALHSVDEAVRCTGKDRLQLLEEWFRTKLPKDLGARDPQPYLTREELVKLVDWKLTHGKWRPKLLEYAKDQDEKDVKEISEKALKALQGCVPGQRDKVQSALQTLTALKGVGPATASAVLAAACPHVPFMSDEALEAAVGKRDYTVKVYMSLVEALQNKAQQLNEQQQQQEEEVLQPVVAWTAGLVEQALWASAVLSRTAGTKSSKGGAAKRGAGSKAPAAGDGEAGEADAGDAGGGEEVGRGSGAGRVQATQRGKRATGSEAGGKGQRATPEEEGQGGVVARRSKRQK
eukprot:CAMPEP_0202903554 /NCGR_PEP_ID=MMETSP1392-20130828/25132_1 /ASSEMBLY_ACC=CAM_ASM_000868 /TAXON_ID=225041 /ORGANISM="Chlamydomonas chlamydogama, Strain SAG 11-48b" /LENGTH=303 /DNA_ID=CAMNT_0049590789 /DNA_START=42 /DNA_END=953 /DNA_ORIENTATION=-